MKSLATLLFLAVSVAACGGNPTDSTCPSDNTLGYANGSAGTDGNFGTDFMTKYCLGCHSHTATNRHGAPGDQNYDTEADVILHADDIDSEAASGPSATNADMPQLSGPVKAAPTAAERVKLGQFLACAKSDGSAAGQ